MLRKFAMTALVASGFILLNTAARAQSTTVASNESFSSCTSQLCIDAPPEGPQGLDGSGGWGWNNSTNKPVSYLFMGHSYPFTVTMMQPQNVPFCGASSATITLTYSSRDFTLLSTDSLGNTGVSTFDRGGVQVFTYSGDFLCHTDQSVAFTFRANHTTSTALVTATVNVDGQQATETFPVSIVKKSSYE